MINSLDINLDDYFKEDKQWLISMPKSSKELNFKFSLTNDEISIDKLDFKDDIELNLIIDLPKTQKEFKKRFLYE